MMERNVVIDDNLLIIEVVRYNTNDIDWQSADLPAIKKIIQAMTKTRHHKQRLRAMGIVVEIEIHFERRRDWLKAFAQDIKRHAVFRNEADAHEEATRVQIIELGAVDDVATLARKITRNGGNNTAGGLAGDGQDKIMHRTSSITQAQLHRDFLLYDAASTMPECVMH
ncbi:hypothetical protein D3C80_108420 [compost metagenome]